MHVFVGLLLWSQSVGRSQADWFRVERLRPGTRMTITYADGHSDDAVFAGANATKLMARHASGLAIPADAVPKDTILQLEIERRYKPAGGKAAVIGAFVALGVLSVERAPANLKVLWMPIGAWIGYTVAPVHRDWKVIYRANRLPGNPI